MPELGGKMGLDGGTGTGFRFLAPLPCTHKAVGEEILVLSEPQFHLPGNEKMIKQTRQTPPVQTNLKSQAEGVSDERI